MLIRVLAVQVFEAAVQLAGVLFMKAFSMSTGSGVERLSTSFIPVSEDKSLSTPLPEHCPSSIFTIVVIFFFFFLLRLSLPAHPHPD
jgi:hypothetical protein